MWDGRGRSILAHVETLCQLDQHNANRGSTNICLVRGHELRRIGGQTGECRQCHYTLRPPVWIGRVVAPRIWRFFTRCVLRWEKLLAM